MTMEQKKIKVLVVEPEKRPYVKEIPNQLESLQQEVGGYIQAVYPFPGPAALLCDEEGKLAGKPLNRALRNEEGHIYDVVAGTFLVVGINGEHFASLTPEQVGQFDQHFQTPEIFAKIGGQLVAIPLREAPPPPQPIYRQSADYAAAHGELPQFRLSHQANVACKEAIEAAIAQHYRNYSLGKEAAQQVTAQFGLDRVTYVLANTVQQKKWDGRFSPENKAWAAAIPVAEVKDSMGYDRRGEFVVDRTNSGLVDLFLRQVRDLSRNRTRSSVVAKLRQNSHIHKPSAPKKREPER